MNYAKALPSGFISLMTPELKLFHSYIILGKLVTFTHIGKYLTGVWTSAPCCKKLLNFWAWYICTQGHVHWPFKCVCVCVCVCVLKKIKKITDTRRLTEYWWTNDKPKRYWSWQLCVFFRLVFCFEYSHSQVSDGYYPIFSWMTHVRLYQTVQSRQLLTFRHIL